MTRGDGCTLDAAVKTAEREHPLDLIGEQQQSGKGGRVVGLLLARVLQRRLQREETGLPALGSTVELTDAGDRRRAERGEPETAVGAECLLRSEVVGVGLARIERQAA